MTPYPTIVQGKIEMWVEIVTPEEAMATPMVSLKPPIPDPWQLRVVIWHVLDVPLEGSSSIDLFVSGEPDGYDEQQTDTHMGSNDGRGNFNFRFVWDISLPNKKKAPRLKLAVCFESVFLFVCFFFCLNGFL
jgi:hypothetical protein